MKSLVLHNSFKHSLGDKMCITCNFVDDTKLQGVLSTLKDKFKINVGFVVGCFLFLFF